MSSDRIFQIAFIISLAAHGVVLFQNLNLSILPKVKKEQKIEISYIKEPSKTEKDVCLRRAIPRKESFLKISAKITPEFKVPPPFTDKENIFKKTIPAVSQDSIFIKPVFIKPDIIAIKKKISLPPIDLEKINNPAYISYYQIVREKIKRAAYQNYNRNETGSAYISFVISNIGELKNIQLIEEKSSSNQYLKDVALKSISDAAAFPSFPEELDYAQLSFNVIISFEIE